MATMLLKTAARGLRGAEDVSDATQEREPIDCIITGMDWYASPTRVEAVFNVDGQLLRGHFINLAYMFITRDSLLEDGSFVEVKLVKMLEHPTLAPAPNT